MRVWKCGRIGGFDVWGKKEEETLTDQYSRLLFSLLMTKVEYDSAKPR